MINKLQDIFREVFNEESVVLSPTTDANDVKGWDSMSHIHLIVAVEDEFNVSLSAEEAVGFQNVGELIQLIAKKHEKQ